MWSRQNLKADFSAGFSVSLVALPLSIGIALASGAPASSGLIAAIIGGLVGSIIGGSQLTINGPTAGLIVIVLDAIINLGNGDAAAGFRGMLAAAVVAGALQVAFGLLKLGRKGVAFPVSVIHGMMAAIGLIILAKQLHILTGYAPQAKNPIMLFAELPEAFTHLHPMIFSVGAICLLVLLAWSRLPFAFVKKIPAPLVAVVVGVVLGYHFNYSQRNLLQVPSDLSSWLISPDFEVMLTFAGWKAAITIALVASLETVLSAAAVDKLDPEKRESDLDRDLWSKGICNMLSASIGGLPMIAEIVRSSANISYGAKSRQANFFHGALILLAVICLPHLLTLIPLASLAAVLVVVGGRLGNPAHIRHAKEIGFDNLTGFMVTLVVTMAVDLLAGIFLGALAQLLIEFALGLKVKNAVRSEFRVEEKEGASVEIFAESSLTFCNFLGLKEVIRSYGDKAMSVQLELSECEYIDHSVMEQLDDLKKSFIHRHLRLEVKISKKHHALGESHLSALKKVA